MKFSIHHVGHLSIPAFNQTSLAQLGFTRCSTGSGRDKSSCCGPCSHNGPPNAQWASLQCRLHTLIGSDVDWDSGERGLGSVMHTC